MYVEDNKISVLCFMHRTTYVAVFSILIMYFVYYKILTYVLVKEIDKGSLQNFDLHTREIFKILIYVLVKEIDEGRN